MSFESEIHLDTVL